MDTAIWVIIACGALSIVYGIWAIQSVMASDAGTKRMQEIAGAIQEGATAYLTRQYTMIGIAGIVALPSGLTRRHGRRARINVA